MAECLISVVMCVRDGEKYLPEALDSIADQRVDGLEVVVVDDASSRSASIARAHALKPMIESRPPLGLCAGLNHGIDCARGTFLAFLDCDDVWPAGRLADMLAILEHETDLDGVYGGVVNTDGKLAPIAAPTAARLAGAMVMRRASALRVGPFRTDLAHAGIIDWNSRAAKAGWRDRALDRVVLLRRVHGDNMGIKDRPRARDDLLQTIRDHVRRNRS